MPSSADDQLISHNEREKVGMVLPPPVLLLIAMVLGTSIHVLLFGSFTFTLIRSILGSALVFLSILAIGACVYRFRSAGTPFRPVTPATTIVNSGLYRVSRNPMYLGMAGVLLGSSVLLGSYALALALPMFVLIVHFGVVLPEERYLESLHADSYCQYKQSVPRWL